MLVLYNNNNNSNNNNDDDNDDDNDNNDNDDINNILLPGVGIAVGTGVGGFLLTTISIYTISNTNNIINVIFYNDIMIL